MVFEALLICNMINMINKYQILSQALANRIHNYPYKYDRMPYAIWSAIEPNPKLSALLAYDDSGLGNIVVRLSTVGHVACVGHNYATVVRTYERVCVRLSANGPPTNINFN